MHVLQKMVRKNKLGRQKKEKSDILRIKKMLENHDSEVAENLTVLMGMEIETLK